MLFFDRAKSTYLFVDADEVFAEFVKAMELIDLLLRFAQGCRTGEGFGHALARHSSGETELRKTASGRSPLPDEASGLYALAHGHVWCRQEHTLGALDISPPRSRRPGRTA
jgi:hypothetical protein